MSLRGNPVTERVVLPDGRAAAIRVGVPDNSYIPKSQLDTVAVEVLVAGEVAASLNTVLDPDQVNEARELAREIASGLESGELEPTAGAIEPLANTRR